MQYFAVTGTMRSGTTLMADLLCSSHTRTQRHPDLLLANEGFPPFRLAFQQIEQAKKSSFPWIRLSASDFPLALPNLPDAANLGEMVALLKWELEKTLNARFQPGTPPGFIGLKYTNFFNYIETIWQVAPDFRTIVMVRDPRDVYVSNKLRKPPAPGSTSHLLIIQDMLELWHFLQAHQSDIRLKTVRYETLALDHVATITECLSFLGASPDRYAWETLDTVGVVNNSSVGSNKKAGAVGTGEKVNRPSAHDHLSVCSREEMSFLEGVMGEFMSAFGYAPRYEAPTWKKSPLVKPFSAEIRKRSRSTELLEAALSRP